jgi:hypothetical protein
VVYCQFPVATTMTFKYGTPQLFDDQNTTMNVLKPYFSINAPLQTVQTV